MHGVALLYKVIVHLPPVTQPYLFAILQWYNNTQPPRLHKTTGPYESMSLSFTNFFFTGIWSRFLSPLCHNEMLMFCCYSIYQYTFYIAVTDWRSTSAVVEVVRASGGTAGACEGGMYRPTALWRGRSSIFARVSYYLVRSVFYNASVRVIYAFFHFLFGGNT